MALADELQASLRELSSAPSVEVRENGGRVAVFATLSWEVRGAGQKPLLHLWSDQYNLTRRVLAITDQTGQRLALTVERFGRNKPDRLEFLRMEFERSSRDISREEACALLARILTEQFPDEKLELLTAAQDLEHSLSGSYARGLLRSGSTQWAVLAFLTGESAAPVHHALTFGLLWLDRVQKSSRGIVAGLRLIVPKDAGRVFSHYAQALNAGLHLQIYELDPLRENLGRIDPGSAGNLDSWLVPNRESQALLERAKSGLGSIVALSPQAIAVHVSVQSREVWLRFRGLVFAYWDDGKVWFGVGDRKELLTPASQAALRHLVKDLENHRDSAASDRRHPLYRPQPERWLESIVREDVTRIDADLDSRFSYTQVFANGGGQSGILDVLTTTRTGRLAILELKATEYIHLPLQAADYWLRIRRHQLQGDFASHGYFYGIQLQDTPPLVYLVAPALRFHPTTEIYCGIFHRRLSLFALGLWRTGGEVFAW